MDIRIDSREVRKLKRKMSKFTRKFDKELDGLSLRYSKRLLEQTLINASGRPGPEIVTGEYISNFVVVRWTNQDRSLGFGVFNSSPEALRLEFGFIGTDSLGRNYNQPAYSHMGPALVQVAEEFSGELKALPVKVWRSL